MALNEETIIGPRASKAAVEECGGVTKVPIAQDLLKVATNSHRLYTRVYRASERGKSRENTKRS